MDLENFPTRETARDMMGMISPIYDDSYVGKWIFEVMSAPLALAQEVVDDLKNQAFPETATWSLPYWEQSYNIVTNEALSIEERRSAIIRKRNFRKPMNPARIEMLLSEVCGRDVELVENVAPHIFEIKIGPGVSDVDLRQAMDLLDEIKQSQKSYRIVFEVPVSVRIRAEPLRKLYQYRAASARNITGRFPYVNEIGQISRTGIRVRPRSENRAFPYVMAGTVPGPAYNASLTSLQLQAAIEGRGDKFPYTMAGTRPETSVTAEMEKGGVSAQVEGRASGITYKICGSSRKL